MSNGTFERDEVIALSLLSALSGESIFLLGLPGVGKSMVARRLKSAFSDAKVFEYLMSRFSTPDEIFGPVSISRLKNHDTYERITTGYLPEAEIVFLDEIWKAGPAIQNALLTVLNERIYLNGNRELKLPLKGVIAASNELPAKDEGLEALWDRFLLRYIVEPIASRENFIRLLSDNDYAISTIPPDSPNANSVKDTPQSLPIEPISEKDYYSIRRAIKQIYIPSHIIDLICTIREKINALINRRDAVSGQTDPSNRKFYVSDRRWKKAVGVMRTSALLNDRKEVDISDMLLFGHILWNDESSISPLANMICEEITLTVFRDILEQHKSNRRHVCTAKQSASLFSPDGIRYVVQCEGSPMLIDMRDYEMVRNHPKEVFFASENSDNQLILREMGQYALRFNKPGHLCINSYDYPLKTTADAELGEDFMRGVSERLDYISRDIDNCIDKNLFTHNSSMRPTLRRAMGDLRRRIEGA